MITGLWLIANPEVYSPIHQMFRDRWAQQQMVYAQPGVGLPMLTEIIPEGIHRLVGIQPTYCIDPSLLQQSLKALPTLGLEQRILFPGARAIDILVSRHHII